MKTLLRTKPISEQNEAPMEISFQFVDGSGANFFQSDPEIAGGIWSRIKEAYLFTRPRIVVTP